MLQVLQLLLRVHCYLHGKQTLGMIRNEEIEGQPQCRNPAMIRNDGSEDTLSAETWKCYYAFRRRL